MIEYPTGAVQSINELKVGDKIFSITLPKDATDSNAVSNTINLVPYIIDEFTGHNAILHPITDPNRRINITIYYRNINPNPNKPLEHAKDCRRWFLFKNYWHAWAYYRRFIDEQSIKTT